jgi:hypothetical protein
MLPVLATTSYARLLVSRPFEALSRVHSLILRIQTEVCFSFNKTTANIQLPLLPRHRFRQASLTPLPQPIAACHAFTNYDHVAVLANNHHLRSAAAVDALSRLQRTSDSSKPYLGNRPLAQLAASQHVGAAFRDAAWPRGAISCC